MRNIEVWGFATTYIRGMTVFIYLCYVMRSIPYLNLKSICCSFLQPSCRTRSYETLPPSGHHHGSRGSREDYVVGCLTTESCGGYRVWGHHSTHRGILRWVELTHWSQVKMADILQTFGEAFLVFSTHCGLVMPYGVIELGQHWFRVIIWTNHEVKIKAASPRCQWVKRVSLHMVITLFTE